ncbi:cytochrome b/b6 domain-containing protein [uncultured Sunxiuqinia sp.]|jgi:thiosulfate reductase cytochrome b subunit|uniref:cytochrome b/b6 domain-containing protein n=1 Tax=uncultured Sunxiuqinia sp. TaxID=1573825 RepID=UPI0030D97573|tara:strand:+ start:79873 stop:80514 length:642 start_codon:yes stop_codon:yes gene_type:complete
MRKVYIYKGFERFWHWTQASLILFLAATGFEVHGSFEIFGFEKAVQFHRVASWMLIGLIVFAIFWHITTGEWKQYIPTTRKLKEQLLYYVSGIFKGEKHPTTKTELSKLNPLQRMVYLSFKIILIPLTIISGIFYLLYKTIDQNNLVVVEDYPLEGIAFWHTLGAILLMVFLIVHVYMTTTGETPTSNIKAMLTGYEDLEDTHTENEPLKNTK